MKSRVSFLSLFAACTVLMSCGGGGDGASDTIQAGKFTVLGTRTDGADRAAARAFVRIGLGVSVLPGSLYGRIGRLPFSQLSPRNSVCSVSKTCQRLSPSQPTVRVKILS